jgi:hypothetical protein
VKGVLFSPGLYGGSGAAHVVKPRLFAVCSKRSTIKKIDSIFFFLGTAFLGQRTPLSTRRILVIGHPLETSSIQLPEIRLFCCLPVSEAGYGSRKIKGQVVITHRR